MSQIYRVKNWNDLYENSRSRKVETLGWVPIPNRHDGEQYTLLITHKNGSEIYAAWILILQVASKCEPRGTLLKSSGQPHDAASLSLKTRAPEKWFKMALEYLSKDAKWLELQDINGECQPDTTQLPPDRHPSAEERIERREGKEGKATCTLDELKAYCKELGLPDSDGETLFYKWEGNGWVNGKQKIANWKATVQAWKRAGYLPSQRVGQQYGQPAPTNRPKTDAEILREAQR